MQPYVFNKDAVYKAGAVYSMKKKYDFVYLDICVSETAKFTTRVRDVFSQYQLPNVSSNHVVDLWSSQPMGFWQTQLNFAVWCATSGCGMSAKNHLDNPSRLSQAIYRFHAYYQTRRILHELSVALPEAASWNAYENGYSHEAYAQLCREFNVSPDTDWRRKGLPNYGLGSVYTNGHPIGDGWYYPNHVFGWRGSGVNVTHDLRAPSGWLRESFTDPSDQTTIHADYIAQDSDPAWTTFVVDESQGFTQAGIERLNDSIRTYVWAILGAQGQTRTNILGAAGTAFDAQKQFLNNMEDAIASPVDIPSSIDRYQKVLQYARSKVDYVIGYDLYMTPSDMQLQIGQLAGYNNQIVTATKDMQLGSNMHINNTVPPASVAPKGPLPAHHIPEPLSPHEPTPTTSVEDKVLATQHADEKTALIVGGVAVGLLAIWFLH